MKIKHLILMITAAVAASSLHSCIDEPYVITPEEEYTRNFIKNFGLIDPNQNWNLAKKSAVTVKVGTTPAHVKAYMKVDKTYYLVANLTDVSGTLNIPFDMPEGTNDILVKINDARYYTTPGGTVDPAAPASRAVNETTNSLVSIKVLPDEREDGGVNFLSINPKDQTKFTEILKEDGGSHSDPEETNLIKKADDITENFVAWAKTFWIFPEYWDTERFDTNTIGIYIYADKTTENAISIKDVDGKESWVVKVPIYQPKGEGVSVVDNLISVTAAKDGQVYFNNDWSKYWEEIYKTMEELNANNQLPEGWELATADGSDKYKNLWGSTISAGTKVLRISPDKPYFEFSNWYYITQIFGNDEYALLARIIAKTYPEYGVTCNWNSSDNSFLSISGIIPENRIETVLTGRQGFDGSTIYYKSRCIELTFTERSKFGFYLELKDGPTLFSESRFNETLYYDGELYSQASYVCTFKQGTDTYGNTLRRLCFEDWWSKAERQEDGRPGSAEFGENTNFDMNDMVFRIYGFDEIKSHPSQQTFATLDEDPDDDEDPGEENPTPPTEVDETYHWLLAVEDLGATDDFDFNDIIIGISSLLTNEIDNGARKVGSPIGDNQYNKVTFTALAAGGTLPAYVYFGNELLYPDGKNVQHAEWHQWFGYDNYTKMINTGRGTDNIRGGECTIYFGKGSDGKELFSLETLGVNDKNSAGDAYQSAFKIGIDKEGNITDGIIPDGYFTKGDNYFLKLSGAGAAPQMFLIPDCWNSGDSNTVTKWNWPKERTHIKTCYSDFEKWVADKSTAPEWYKNRTTGADVCRLSPN